MKIIGTGACPGLLTVKAISAIKNARIIYGSKRACELAKDHIRCEFITITDYSSLSALPDDTVVLSTGDPMLSGLGKYAKKGDEVIPGISCVQLVCSRLGIEESGLVAITAHARDMTAVNKELIYELRGERTVVLLPDPDFDTGWMARYLLQEGIMRDIAVCERIGYPDERIDIGNTDNPPAATSGLYCLVIGRDIKLF